jgi:phosphatidylglycerophosphate synthase
VRRDSLLSSPLFYLSFLFFFILSFPVSLFISSALLFIYVLHTYVLFPSSGSSIFFYQTLDNMDGKQARRTGSSSSLGMIFDHGCDSINATIITIVMASVFGVGWTVDGIFFGGSRVWNLCLALYN